MKYLLSLALLILSACSSPTNNPKPSPTPSASVAPVSTVTPTPSIAPSPSATPIARQGIDLRACDSPIETQNTPNCTAFSIVGVLSNLACDHNRLSEHHAWSLYEQYSVDAAANSVPGNNITTWDMWTESASKPKSGYLEAAKHQLTGMKYIDEDDDIEYGLKVLDSKRPLYLGLSVPSDMAAGYSNIRSKGGVSSGGHAVEVVGYVLDPKAGGGGWHIIKNSWGTSNGDQGYQYMEFSMCSNSKMYCFWYEPTGFK